MTTPIDLGEVAKIASADPIWAERGKAIQAYASLEQSLCMLFAQVADLRGDIAATIFFKITSTQARNSIVDRLIRKRYGSTYNLFWNSFLEQLHPIDLKRNEIVHWNAASSIGPIVTVSLIPPNFWDMDKNSPRVTVQDLLNFIHKCDVFARLCTMFFAATRQNATG